MNAVININKPAHITSQQAVKKAKRLLGAKKAGHAGTLDPIATGVLLVCLNEATKITRFLSDLDKEYVVQLKLGEKTDTYDSTGRILETRECRPLPEKDIEEVLGSFTGSVQQTPPMYSAVKIGGRPLYKLARRGITVERAERIVQIFRAELLSYSHPYVRARVRCSKGTYIRSLCDDIGDALGTGAHMTQLVRTGVGNFRVEDGILLTDLPAKKDEFHPVDHALSHLREIVLDHDSWQKAKNGLPVNIPAVSPMDFLRGPNDGMSGASFGECEYVRMKSPDRVLVGIGALGGGTLRVERLFNTNTPDTGQKIVYQEKMHLL